MRLVTYRARLKLLREELFSKLLYMPRRHGTTDDVVIQYRLMRFDSETPHANRLLRSQFLTQRPGGNAAATG